MMNSEKKESKKGALFLIVAALIVIGALILIIRPYFSKEPELRIVQKQVKQETPSGEEKPSALASKEPAMTQPTKPEEVLEKPVLTPPIVSTTKPLTHIVQKGDCLWNIAHNEFGDPFKWTLIYEANKSKINNPDLIYPNQEFDIPKNNK